MPKHYLITGGAGFIGSHLAEHLLAQGHRVTLLDDFSTGRMENIHGLLSRSEVGLVRASVEEVQTVNLAVQRADAVFHLAAAVGVQLIADQPVRTISTIIRGTEVVLEAANRWRKPVLITSSSEVYGFGTKVPFSETDDIAIGPTVHPRWCYAYAKGIDEFLGLAYHKQFALPVIVIRLFNTVGPRQVGQYGMVLPRFVEKALAGQTIPVTGDGTQTRCFCHVVDVVSALARLIETPAASGEVFNLGSDQEISIRDLAERIVEKTGSASRIELLPYEKVYGQHFEDVPRRVPDLAKIERTIGFRRRFDLDQIIDAVIADKRSLSQ
jgi:UDP-glucose 4-epimerase